MSWKVVAAFVVGLLVAGVFEWSYRRNTFPADVIQECRAKHQADHERVYQCIKDGNPR